MSENVLQTLLDDLQTRREGLNLIHEQSPNSASTLGRIWEIDGIILRIKAMINAPKETLL